MALNFLNNGYFAGKVGIGVESPDSQLELYQDSTGGTGAQTKLGSATFESIRYNYHRISFVDSTHFIRC